MVGQIQDIGATNSALPLDKVTMSCFVKDREIVHVPSIKTKLDVFFLTSK